MTIQFANNVFYFVDHWRLVAIAITNLKWHTTPMWMLQGMKSSLASYSMHKQTTATFSMLVCPNAKYNCKISLCMALPSDRIGQWAGGGHTRIEVINKTEQPVTKTYFDCAGGHGGPGTQGDLVQGTCDRNEVVRMSIGNNIDTAHSLKPAYGSRLTNGAENVNVPCNGKLKWDGYYHQIA
jgi:hypothetical protein